jgi:hypothetical protein
MQVIYLKVACTLARWKILCPEEKRIELEGIVAALETLAQQAPRLMWPEPE